MRDKKMEQTIKAFVVIILISSFILFVKSPGKKTEATVDVKSVKIENVE